ncbi:MAG: hypothetical protein VX421_11330, partial [Pseudomonadota bacterium]|nr:hypothetical protein [Pseudomonadota bacterium]
MACSARLLAGTGVPVINPKTTSSLTKLLFSPLFFEADTFVGLIFFSGWHWSTITIRSAKQEMVMDFEQFYQDKYPAGVPREIDLNKYKSMVDVFEQAVKKFADRPAFSAVGAT